MIDRNGNLVGINTFIVTSGGGSEGLGFAIPEPIVRFVYNELKAHGIVSTVTIGAHAQTITPALAAGLKLPQDWGVILSDIDAGGPAAAAGLRQKDMVTAIDGGRVDSLPKYTGFLYVHKRNTPLKMEVLRDGKPLTVSVTPVDAPPTIDNLSDLIDPKKDLIASLGIFVIDLKASSLGAIAESPLRRMASWWLACWRRARHGGRSRGRRCDPRHQREAAGGYAAVAADARRLESRRCGGA